MTGITLKVRAVLMCLKIWNGGKGNVRVIHVSVHSCYVSFLKGCCGGLILCGAWRTFYSRLYMRAGFQFSRWQVPLSVAI